MRQRMAVAITQLLQLFLFVVPDARFGALGDAGIGLSADPNSMHFNASNLTFAENLGVSVTFTPWLRALGLTDVSWIFIRI